MPTIPKFSVCYLKISVYSKASQKSVITEHTVWASGVPSHDFSIRMVLSGVMTFVKDDHVCALQSKKAMIDEIEENLSGHDEHLQKQTQTNLDPKTILEITYMILLQFLFPTIARPTIRILGAMVFANVQTRMNANFIRLLLYQRHYNDDNYNGESRIQNTNILPVFTKKNERFPPFSNGTRTSAAISRISIIAMNVLPVPVPKGTIRFDFLAFSSSSSYKNVCVDSKPKQRKQRLPGTALE